MREAIGGGWLFQIVIFFVLLFAGYLAISINFSKAYRVKNELIDIVERNKGVEDLTEIQAFLDDIGYKSRGKCYRAGEDDDNSRWYGLNDNGELEEVFSNNEEYYLCVKLNSNKDKVNHSEIPYSGYFRIIVFFNLDLPVLGNLFDLTVVGDSHTIYYPNGLD